MDGAYRAGRTGTRRGLFNHDCSRFTAGRLTPLQEPVTLGSSQYLHTLVHKIHPLRRVLPSCPIRSYVPELDFGNQMILMSLLTTRNGRDLKPRPTAPSGT